MNERETTEFGVYQYQGRPNHPWNGMIIYTVTTPDKSVKDLLSTLNWSQEEFVDEQKRGLWTKLPTDKYLNFDEEGNVVIYTINNKE